jgi:mannose-6-phosphate isomerase-like protein (cupin superfamily)
MTLAPGEATGKRAEAHEKSDQVLLMLSGKLSGTVGPETVDLKKGDVLLIRAGSGTRAGNERRRLMFTRRRNILRTPRVDQAGTSGVKS